MCQNVRDTVQVKTSANLGYNFLVSHCFKILYLLRNANIDVNNEANLLRDLGANQDKTDIIAVIGLWEKLQFLLLV